ncbi:MAG: 5'-nucleotidase, partial [Bacteroidota bacterium]
MNKANVLLLLFCFITCFYACKAPTLTRAEDHRQNVAAIQEGADSVLNALITDYRGQLEAEMNTVIGTIAQSLTLQKPESSLGNWMADVLLEKATFYSKRPVDFALQNYGGIRISELPAGPLTRGKIYELMPFDNQLVILDLPGDIVDTLVR